METKEEFLPGFEPEGDREKGVSEISMVDNIEIKYPESEEDKISCNYCEDVGPCEYCERGKDEIRQIIHKKRSA